MTYKKYRVTFTMDTEVIAESKEEAIDQAKESLLDGDWYYVHDYIDEGKVKLLWKPTKEELEEYLEE